MDLKFLNILFNKSRIARKLISAIILFSSFITLIITSIQLYGDYQKSLSGIHEEIESIRENNLEALSHSIWLFDPTATQIILDSLVKHQDIEYMRVFVNEKISWQTGKATSKRRITTEIPLTYTTAGNVRPIGKLEVIASLDSIYQRLIRKGFYILLSNGIKTFLVALFSFGIFQFLVTRHLIKLGKYAKQVNPGQLISPLSLDRIQNKPGKPDELDDVATALNTMQSRLSNEIIKLKEAKDQIRKSHTLLSDIMEGTTDAIYLKDLKGRYIMVNKATCEAIGKQKEEIIGKDDTELFPSKSAQAISENDLRVIKFGETSQTEDGLETTNGDSIWLTNKSPYRDQEGNIIGLIGLSRNITDVKNYEKEKAELESQLRQLQKVEAIGALAGGIAHDFNNILFPILGYSELLVEDLPEDSPYLKSVNEIVIGAKRAKGLVDQILTFSRQADHKLSPLKPGLIIKEVLKLIRATIPTTIKIEQYVDPNCLMILADPTQIHQVAMNLITNAYHSMQHSEGTLTIKLQNIENINQIDNKLKDSEEVFVWLSVSDTGSGMDSITLEKIFDPYFTTKPKGEGTGLGLSVIQGIIKNYDGQITVKSTPGEGSTFNVYIPALQQKAISESKIEEVINTEGNENILLVDDEHQILRVEKMILERRGYNVETHDSSLKALEVFKADPYRFDLMITDMTMPDIPGDILARKVMDIIPDFPVIACTGFSERISPEKAASIGIKGLLNKPIIKSEFAKMVRSVLDKSKKC